MFYHVIEPGLELRVLTTRDAEPVYQLLDANREHLQRWLPFPAHTNSADDTRAFIRSGLKRVAEEDGFDAGIWLDGAIVGVIGIHRIDRANLSTSIGYWLAKDCEGRGIITRSVRAILDHVFGTLDLHRVEIRCAIENRRSRRIPECLGFTEEGCLRDAQRQGDGYLDLIVYGITAAEWKRDSKAGSSV